MPRTAASAALAALVYLAATPASAQEVPPLQWTAAAKSPAGQAPRTLQFTLSYRTRGGEDGLTSRPVPLRRLEGLTPAEVESPRAQVRFRLRYEAGSFDCEGWFRTGRGSGDCEFAPDAGFAAELERRGVGRPTGWQQLSLALHDVGIAYLDELASQRYPRPDVAELVRAGKHAAGLEFLRGMGAAGYRMGTLQELIRLRDHGVTPEFVREMAALGHRGLPAEDLVRLRGHGVSFRFVREMRELGYGRLTIDQLVQLRGHDVTPDFVRRANARAGIRLPLSELIRQREHDERS
ncbi:MAG TPA: hypothetical protein VGR37_21815 [Longimicrobiaceae bacterium]|nr:hypothetical protein [Longimicrobiaceae bacterium]